MGDSRGKPSFAWLDFVDAGSACIHEIKISLPEHTMRLDLESAENPDRRSSFVLQLSSLKTDAPHSSQIQLTAAQFNDYMIASERVNARPESRPPERESPARSALERARQRAKRYVDKYLRDPALSVDAIATRLNCTTRYLQKAFQGSGQTLRDYIWHQRLTQCYRDLSDPAKSDTQITEIALSWGFNSVTHFSEAFRKRFGLSPSAVRQQWSESSSSALIALQRTD
jgi:AraC-like DNA-binding protein